jgi:hypothetical protein
MVDVAFSGNQAVAMADLKKISDTIEFLKNNVQKRGVTDGVVVAELQALADLIVGLYS